MLLDDPVTAAKLQNQRIRVKYCGIKTLEAALYAEALGVDALGFVFKEDSPRFLILEAAKIIMQKLKPFTSKVGLFVNAEDQLIFKALKELSLDLLQFHGDEPEEFCCQFNKPYIKAIRVQTQDDILRAVEHYPSAQGLLLDAYSHQAYGGTGSQFDWKLIPKTLSKPIILAGGLSVENVRNAIQQVKPYAIDVSSGIESSKGVKSLQKMQVFMQEVNHVK